MIYQIEISPQAEEDIQSIIKFLKYRTTENYANIFWNSILKKINSLSLMPERFRLYDQRILSYSNVRIMPVNKNLIVYNVDNVKMHVTIIRVLSSNQKMIV